MTYQELTNGTKLTANEAALFEVIYNEQKHYINEPFSSIGCDDLATMTKQPVSSIKGTVGSLVKKELVVTYDDGYGDLIYLTIQNV
jgi:DNA-binding MarR family transcriptional regulator